MRDEISGGLDDLIIHRAIVLLLANGLWHFSNLDIFQRSFLNETGLLVSREALIVDLLFIHDLLFVATEGHANNSEQEGARILCLTRPAANDRTKTREGADTNDDEEKKERRKKKEKKREEKSQSTQAEGGWDLHM